MEQGLGRSPPRIQQDKSCRWKYTEKLTLFSQINQTLHGRTPRTFIFHHLHVTRIVSSFSVEVKAVTDCESSNDWPEICRGLKPFD